MITCLLLLFSAKIYIEYASRNIECRPDDIVSVPISFNVPQDLKIALTGRLSGGRIVIQQLDDPNRIGSVETTVHAREKSLERANYNLEQGTETTFEYHFRTDPWTWFTCIRAEMYINMPYNATSLVLETIGTPVEIVKNTSIDILHLKTKDSIINVKNDWTGKRLSLESLNGAINTINAYIRALKSVTMTTTEGEIQVGKIEALENSTIHISARNEVITGDVIQAGSTVTLETSNAEINVGQIISLNDAVNVKTTNGKITSNNVQAATTMDVATINGRISIPVVKAPSVQITTSTGEVNLDHIHAQDKINIEASNGELNATVDTMSSVVTARFRTSNSPISVRMVGNYYACNTSGRVTYNSVI